MNEVTPSSYWIASNALYITLNANGDPDYIVGNATSGAQILVYMKGIDGLEYDAGHNYRRWSLSLSPTYFGTRTAKYVYVAVPRPGNPVGIATVVFPSEHIDIYGKNEQEEQIGSEDFYYIFLQGIISATNAGSTEPRTWQQAVETGTLSSDEALDAGGDNTWWKISTVDDTVHFLKEIVMDAKSFFQNFRLNGHEFVSEAKPGITPLDSENTIVTPLFGNRHYISKDHDDETQGEIGFLKGLWIKAKNLFGIGESGDASFRNLHLAENADIDGVLRSWAGVFANLLQSSNWTGDGHFDTGFRLMKDAAGVTSMVVDNLFVRMKAIFTELEIRKMSYAGGNIIFSHAGGRIVALAGVAYIKGEARVIGHTIYLDDAEVVGHKIILPDGAGEFAYRCYMLADDGTTRTQNWWQVDDQARCQTFNIQAGTYQNVSNSFYWRRVVGTGTEVLSDGKTYDYVDLSATDRFTGTTIDGIDVSGFESVPQTGDQLVQMGNRTDASRQGFVTIEVRGENAPAFKVYKNVSGYSLDNKRKICLSPSLTDLKVQKLSIETEYDSQRVPMERGAWTDIANHRCYYYDLVQHNGATWLCIYPESGIDGVLYTTEEPSATATYWRAYAQKGEQGASTTVRGEAVAHFATWESLIAAMQTGVFVPSEGDYILLDSSDGYEEGEDRPSVVEYVNGPDHTWDIQFPSLLEGWIINGYLWVAQETEWHNNGKWQGDDAINIMLTPESIILNQDLQTKAIDLTQAYSDVTVVKGDVLLSNFVVTIGTGADAPVHCNASVSGNRVRITSILSSGGVYYDNGSVTVKITYNGNTYTKVFKFYVNLLGTWKETVEADTKTAVAEMKYYVYDKDGRVVAEQNIGEYIQSSSINQSTIASTVGGMAGNGGNILAGSELFPVDTKLEHVSTQADGVIEYPQGSSPAIFGAVQLVAGKTYILQIKSDGTLASAHDGSGGTQVGKYTVWLRINGTLDGSAYNGLIFTSQNLTGTLDDGALWWRFKCELTGMYWLRTNTYSDGTTPVTVHFWDLMLEQSTIPSGWSAPSSRVLSQIKQTASQIELSITNKLGETGIKIDGNNRHIDLTAAQVKMDDGETQTIVEGGKIKSSVIDADKVIANGIKGKTIDAEDATFKNILVSGGLRSPFTHVSPGDRLDTQFNDNVVVLSDGIAVFGLPWDVSQSGRRVTVTNYKWGTDTQAMTGYAQLQAPTGKYFFEDGLMKENIQLSRESVELIGYGDSENFYGWIVQSRVNLATHYRYGHQLNVLAMGTVKFISSPSTRVPIMDYKTFDGSTLTMTHLAQGSFRIEFDSNVNWFNEDSDVMVMVTGYGSGENGGVVYANLQGCFTSHFAVRVGDDASLNDGGFQFMVFNRGEWIYLNMPTASANYNDGGGAWNDGGGTIIDVL